MRKTSIIILLSLIVLSCGNNEKSVESVIETGDLGKIREMKSELNKEQNAITQKIHLLDAAIQKLNPNRNFALVTTTTIQDTVFKHYTEVQGDVATDENVIIYPESAGILRQVNVEEGDRVKKGQVLATIDYSTLSNELARLESQAALAKTTFERQQRLWEQHIGSEIQFLEAKTNYEAIQNSVAQIKSQIAKNIVRAPFSGVIDQIFTEEGVVVAPGQNQLFRLINLQNMYVEADVPEVYLGSINADTEVFIDLASQQEEFKGKISRIGRNIDPSNRTFNIEVAIPNEEDKILPNQIASVKFNDYTNKNAIIIPETSVQENSAGENFVFVLAKENGHEIAKEIVVETGRIYDQQVEIINGLEPGQILILEGSKGLRDGQEVILRN